MSGTVYLTCPGGKKYYRSTFRLAGRPRERSFKDLANAKAWLKAQLQNVVRGKAQRAAISAQEVDEYHTAKKLIASSGVSLIEAARAYVATHEGLIETRIDEAVSVFLDFKLSSGVDRENLRITEIYLKKLKEGFSGPIHTLDTATVRDWLASLKGVSNRYRNNISGAINSLLRFGARRNWIREEFSPIERFKVEVTDNVIWEPDELRRLLSAAHLEIVPFLAIAAFAGLRTSELCRLDWSNVSDRHIIVTKPDSKTRARRTIPILANLESWLSVHRRTKGKVVPYSNVTNQLLKVASNAGLDWRKNALRHSFGSYRLALIDNENMVAREMGNSPTVIYSSYHAARTKSQASDWFSIVPLSAASNVIPLAGSS
ncbi:tyrosine-type recombinase/integrase [Verrucomicrobia bacterium]|nr:tyrosine-type recombinase/integrase [Verrucomicrobiota bacterium]